MNLEEAKICIGCDLLFTEGIRCPRCNSEVWTWLSVWIMPLYVKVKEAVK